jgi:hypothetical protein
MALIRAKSKEARDAAERLMEHVATTVAADLRRERNRKHMARIRSKSKEARDAVATATATDLRRANVKNNVNNRS